MPERVWRKYGELAIIDFTLFETGGVNFNSDATHDTGDTKISKDEGGEINTTNGFVDNGTGFSLTLTAAETTARRVFVPIVDQYNKQWLDDYIMVETYGHTSAMHAFNLDADLSTNTEEWKFKGIDIHHDSDFGLSVTSDTTTAVSLVAGSIGPTGLGHGLDIRGHGIGYGAYIKGGEYAGSKGLSIEGVSLGAEMKGASGQGLSVSGTGFGMSISGDTALLLSGTSGYGLRASGTDGGFNISCSGASGDGIRTEGGAHGHGIHALGGIGAVPPSGHGIFAEAQHGDYNGICAKGFDSSAGFASIGGPTGNGVDIIGGSSGGVGLSVTSDTTSAVRLVAGGSEGSAIDATGRYGVDIDAGAHGIQISSLGHGMIIDAGGHGLTMTTDGHGIQINAQALGIDINSQGPGITVDSAGTHAVQFTGGSGGGRGLSLIGGSGPALFLGAIGAAMSINSFAGHGVEIIAGGNGNALDATGGGSGDGFNIRAGATGTGVDIHGGSVSGSGISVNTASGYGIICQAGGVFPGLLVNSGADGAIIEGGRVGLKVIGGGAYSAMEVYNNGGSGPGLSLAGGVLGGNALDATGGGTGHGFSARGGVAGAGFQIVGNSASALTIGQTGSGAPAVNISSNAGQGVSILGATHGVWIRGGGANSGFYSEGGPTGNGMEIVGGATSGNGLDISAPTSGYGVNITGGGSNSGLHIFGGTSGKGMEVVGGSVGQVGLSIRSTAASAVEFTAGSSGSGLRVTGAGSDHGVIFLGGSSGGDGFYCAAQGGNGNGASFNKAGSGKDMDADELDGLLKLTTTVDGKTLEYAYELMMSRVNGKYVLDTPVIGNITMYKRDDTTPLTIVNVTTTERTRVL